MLYDVMCQILCLHPIKIPKSNGETSVSSLIVIRGNGPKILPVSSWQRFGNSVETGSEAMGILGKAVVLNWGG